MSFLSTGYTATVAARLTETGRKAISEGNFNIEYFAVGDSEYNYSGPASGLTSQGIFAPFDKDVHVKYPLWYTSGTTFYGIPRMSSKTFECRNIMSDETWTLDVVWDKVPIGVPSSYVALSSYETAKFSGIKQLLGYTDSDGQTSNTGTTIINSSGTKVTITPEEQKAIAILHYSENSDFVGDTDVFFKYDDYISTYSGTTDLNTLSDLEYFRVTCPNIYYHRSTGSTSGQTFHMSTSGGTIDSNYNSKFSIPYKYLVDDNGYSVGKVFYNNKTIVFDDEDLVATLDDKSNRLYTLATPSVNTVVSTNSPITGLTTGKTMWVTYLMANSGSGGLPCNTFTKVTGSTNPVNVTVKFDSGKFKFLNSGYTANQIYLLYALKNNGDYPLSTDWSSVNVTSDLSAISDLKTGVTFTLNQTKVSSSSTFNLSGFTGADYTTNTSGYFGDETSYDGAVRLVRGTNIAEMIYDCQLPSGKFATSQNPTFISGNAKVTEVALLDNNKRTLVMGKLVQPVTRSGDSTISVRLDF
jgi:hypothetical protein